MLLVWPSDWGWGPAHRPPQSRCYQAYSAHKPPVLSPSKAFFTCTFTAAPVRKHQHPACPSPQSLARFDFSAGFVFQPVFVSLFDHRLFYWAPQRKVWCWGLLVHRGSAGASRGCWLARGGAGKLSISDCGAFALPTLPAVWLLSTSASFEMMARFSAH